MMVIRPIEHADIAALMQLASKTGGGLTSLPCHSTSPLTGFVFTRRAPSPVTQSPFIHNVMLLSPLHKDAQNVHGHPRGISGRPVALPSAPVVGYSGRHALT